MTRTRYRSWLCSSCLRPDLSEKLAECAPDVLFLDLEDSVPPALKSEARLRTAAFLETQNRPPAAVRINALASSAGMADLLAFSQEQLTAEMVILPKVECARDLQIAEQLLMAGGWRGEMYALIETPQAIRNLDQIASSGSLLAGLVFGAADLCAGIGVAIDGMGAAAVCAKYEIASAAAANGLRAIDSPCFPLDNVRLEEELSLALELGFEGKLAIHPSQIAAINTKFAPSDEEIARARRVVELWDDSGGGVFRFDGQMMGPPFAQQAKRVLRRGQSLTL